MAGRDEFGLIAELFAPLAAGWPGTLNLTDDAALIPEQPGSALVATSDCLVAGVHFLPDDPPDLIARKALRVNLSDLAAMAAEPLGVLLACAFPKGCGEAWLRRFADGLAEDCRAFGIHLLGGDTVVTPGPATFTVTALGRVRQGRELRRSGAQAGDLVWVSGTIGDAALGLKLLQGRGGGLAGLDGAPLIRRYHLPEPRVGLGPRLAGLARAGMDVSDGLVADLGHICDCSGLAAVIEAAAVPLSPAAAEALARDQALLASILTGGDDYELLFTAGAQAEPAIRAAAAEAGVTVTPIGRMVAGQGVTVLDRLGKAMTLPAGGWNHFGG